MSAVAQIDRLTSSRRPAGSIAGYHVWTNLLFVHWRVPAAEIQRLLPRELTVDTYDGSAWVGLVPFYMSWVRPWWAPALPGLSFFCETNVRTYVHRRGEQPGVWFFGLEASNSIAVQVARRYWHLNYHYASMSLRRQGERVAYRCQRHWPGLRGAGTNIEIETGPLCGSGDSQRSLPPGQPCGQGYSRRGGRAR